MGDEHCWKIVHSGGYQIYFTKGNEKIWQICRIFIAILEKSVDLGKTKVGFGKSDLENSSIWSFGQINKPF